MLDGVTEGVGVVFGVGEGVDVFVGVGVGSTTLQRTQLS